MHASDSIIDNHLFDTKMFDLLLVSPPLAMVQAIVQAMVEAYTLLYGVQSPAELHSQ